MNMIARLQETFGFTRNELKVILFLTAALAIGAGVRWYASSSRPMPGAPYDYAVADRTFAEHSQRSPVYPSPSPASSVALSRQPPSAVPPVALSINVNTASKVELMRLPGIGDTYAGRIIRYRKEHGPFASVEDLDRVQGIGKKTLARLRPFVHVRGEAGNRRVP